MADATLKLENRKSSTSTINYLGQVIQPDRPELAEYTTGVVAKNQTPE